MEMQIASPMTRGIVAVGRKEYFRYRPITYADPITEPIFVRRDGIDWWYIDRKDCHIEVPWTADRAKYPIIKAGYNVVQEYVGEEVPKLLTVRKEPPPAVDYRETLEDIFTATGRTLRRIGQGLAWIVAMGLLIDPALLCVVEVENGQYVHVEVARWYP